MTATRRLPHWSYIFGTGLILCGLIGLACLPACARSPFQIDSKPEKARAYITTCTDSDGNKREFITVHDPVWLAKVRGGR